MSFGPDLDLSDILSDIGLWGQQPDQEAAEAAIKYKRPVLLGTGPELFSSCQDLMLRVVICHDVNGYYKVLNASPTATRRELMQAYVAINGQADPYLTYVFKQLLNPEIRKAYDEMPSGSTFLDDYTQDEMRRNAVKEAIKRTKTGQMVNSKEVLDEWGYVCMSPEEEAEFQRFKETNTRGFEYKYWAWNTSQYVQDEKRLSAWQSLLLLECGILDKALHLSIGVAGLIDGQFLVDFSENGYPIVYLAEDSEVTQNLAQEAIQVLRRKLQDGNSQRNR